MDTATVRMSLPLTQGFPHALDIFVMTYVGRTSHVQGKDIAHTFPFLPLVAGGSSPAGPEPQQGDNEEGVENVPG